MIPFEFEYYRPDSLNEAVGLCQRLNNAGKKPLYFAGGTEIISMARVSTIYTGAVIDIKHIPELKVMEWQSNRLVIGAAVTLTQITEAKMFPLLDKSAGRIADHTIQGKITLGGNLAGTIIYREAVLPLLLVDAEALIAGPEGLRQVPLQQVFQERLRLDQAELLVQIIVDGEYMGLPYTHVKKTKQDKINYPLVTAAALKKDGRLRVALSGICSFPFRSMKIEDELNYTDLPIARRIDRALQQLPGPLVDDMLGSSQYRAFVLKNTLFTTFKTLEVQ